MNIYQKLLAVRLELAQSGIKPSGENKFAGYKYMELGDFMPKATELFAKHNLCPVVSFGQEMATLHIVDAEKPESVLLVTSPMRDATLKGCHPIQNLGAVETYTRRYLFMAALDIVESDAIDKAPAPSAPHPPKATEPAPTPAASKQPTPKTDDPNSQYHKACAIIATCTTAQELKDGWRTISGLKKEFTAEEMANLTKLKDDAKKHYQKEATNAVSQ